MHRIMPLILMIVLLGAAATARGHQSKDTEAKARAQQLLKQAREALGGEAKLKAIQSFSASGKYRRLSQLQGQSSFSDGEIGFDFLLPDKFLKSETRSLSSDNKVTNLRGLNGDQYFQDSISSNPETSGRSFSSPGSSDPVSSLRAEFSRYLLAWLLTSPASFPLEFSYAGEAKTPEGQADILAVKGPQSFAARLFLDQQTHRPLMLSYRGKAQRQMTITGGGGQPINLNDALKEAQRLGSQEEEIELRFSEYRAVDGLLLPHRVKQSASGQETEEWILQFQLNPPLKPEKFQKK